jgi:hypothetical protein
MKHPLLVFIFSLLCASVMASVNDRVERDALIAVYLEWRGSETLENVSSLTRTGTLAFAGLSGSITVTQVRDGRQLVNADLQVIQMTEALLPEGSWIVNPSGQVEDMGSVPETNAQRSLALELALPLFDAGSNVTLLDDEEKDGATWGVLRIAYKDGDYHDLLVNKDTGSLSWIRVRKDTETYWLHYTDWTVVDGIRFAGTQHELHENAAENVIFTWVETSVNAPISNVIFKRPSNESRVTIKGDATSTSWIDFDFFRDNRIFMPALINGIATEAVLDSGAEMTAISVEVAHAAGLIGEGSAVAKGTGGTTEVQFASGVTITIGNLQLNDLAVVILDLKSLGQRLLGRPIPIILGKEVFNEMIVDIDYPKKRIAFYEPGQWSYDGTGSTVALPELDGLRVVKVGVEGGKSISAGFDIGQGSALTLFEAYVDDSGLLDGRATSTRLGGGVGGEVISTLTSVRTINFGGVQFEDIPVSLTLDAKGAFDTKHEQANLGTGIFSRFRMIVNYSADELYLEPDPTKIDVPFARNRAGLQLQIVDGAAEITHIMPGSPAAESGLVVGDSIVTINGHAVGNDYWTDKQWRWSQESAGTSVVLITNDDREFELILVDFY